MMKYLLVGLFCLSGTALGATLDLPTAQAIKKNVLDIRKKADDMANYTDYVISILEKNGKVDVKFTDQQIDIPQPVLDQLADSSQIQASLDDIQNILADTKNKAQAGVGLPANP